MNERELESPDDQECLPIISSPEIIELVARGAIGCDIQIELLSASYRGPIKVIGVTYQRAHTNEPGLYFNLEWIAENKGEGWKLHEEPNDLLLGARLCVLSLNDTYIFRNEDLTIDVVAPGISSMIKIYPPGDNLKKEDLISP